MKNSKEEYDKVWDSQIKVLMDVENVSYAQANQRMQAFKKSDLWERYHMDKMSPEDKFFQIIIDIVMSIPQLALVSG